MFQVFTLIGVTKGLYNDNYKNLCKMANKIRSLEDIRFKKGILLV